MMAAPKIRFKGFADAWEQRKFNGIVNRVAVQSNAAHLPKVEFEDIVSGEGLLNKDISSKFDKRKGIAFKPGNILFGKLRPYLKNWLFPDFMGVALGDFWVFEAIDSVPIFDYYLIQTEKYQEIANLSTGTKMPRSDWKIVSETDFSIPPVSEEQTAIGNFFRTLDDTITLHKRKLDGLKALKKGYLQQMFPQAGERVPRVRFAGFSGDWVERMLGEYITDFIEKTTVQNQHPVLTSSQKEGIVFQEDYFANRQITTDENIGYYVLPRGYFAYRSRTDNGIFRFNRNDIIDRGIISYFYPVFSISPNGDSEFFLRLLNSTIQKQADVAAEGTGQRVLSLKKFKSIKAFLPDLTEQTAIGNFFRGLDEQIATQQTKLDKLKQLKVAYLQSMFV